MGDYGEVVGVTVGLLIVVGVFLLVRRFARAGQQRAFIGLNISSAPAPGRVQVVFHTYHGLLLFVTQSEYRFWASADDARIALWRLHRFNLTWGLFAYGVLLIPLFSLGNYRAQLRSIRRQLDSQAGETRHRR